MKVFKTSLIDCLILKPDIFQDDRGFFLETFRSNQFAQDTGILDTFIQDNHSHSSRGVLRGLHFQSENPQGKLVRASRGSILDVAVDLRIGSRTFGHSEVFELSAQNCHQVWVPPGFAHGFLVLSDFADFQYKCTQYYDPSDEQAIHWQDPDLNIPWPVGIERIVSSKDSNAQSFKEYCDQVGSKNPRS
tara:strand:+ start:34036 stop:34602 length:567 start_codon:yes stop_codon:yes gene_type:complete